MILDPSGAPAKVRDPGAWDAELPPEGTEARKQAIADKTATVGTRCPHCGRGYFVALMPWSPRVAKSECPNCLQTHDVVTREEAMDGVREAFEHNFDVAQVAQHPKAFSKDLGRPKKKRARRG